MNFKWRAFLSIALVWLWLMSLDLTDNVSGKNHLLLLLALLLLFIQPRKSPHALS